MGHQGDRQDECGAPMTVHFRCRDPKASIAYYRDMLGFTLKEVWPDEDNPMWASLRLNGQSVMLGGSIQLEQIDEYCADDPMARDWWKTQAAEDQGNARGVGIVTYVMVDDVDAYHATITKNGAKPKTGIKTQFYGLRDFGIQDPDGYRLLFYTPVAMESCQSCGMPLAEAKPGDMFCHLCVDKTGKLRPYEAVFEGCVTGFFMGVQKMSRPDAEKAAREHLAKMPAWVKTKVDA